MPHGPGTALFPVPRVDWMPKGQSNACDFGRLVVGDFLLWKIDILDICFTKLLYDQFKIRLGTEIAKALRIAEYRVHIFDIEDKNPYHDPYWMQKRCTMTYPVPIRLRKGLPAHLRRVSRASARDYAINLVPEEMLTVEPEDPKAKKKKKPKRSFFGDLDPAKKPPPPPLPPPAFKRRRINKPKQATCANRLRETVERVRRDGLAVTVSDMRSGMTRKKYKEDGDEELGDPEPCEDAVLASSTFRSRVRIRFHVSGARDGVEEPHLDEVIFDMKRQLTQFETSPLLNKGVYHEPNCSGLVSLPFDWRVGDRRLE